MTSNIENGDSKPYWEGAREGRLRFQQCKSCGHTQFPPRHLCVKCWNDELVWTDSAGQGRVESFTIVHRAPTPELRNKVPYVVAAVLFDEGPRLITNVVGPRALEVTIGDPVTVTFVTDSAGCVLPQSQLAGS
jgi:uncharacterized OB-fold protein